MRSFLKHWHPSFWYQQATYNKAWEDLILANMHHKFVPLSRHAVTLGPLTLWVANYPYACFTSYNILDLNVRPSRKLIYQLREKLVNEVI